MLLLRVFTLFMKERRNLVSERADAVQIKKRAMMHKGIPDLATVKGLTGNNFNALQQIFNSFDPAGGEKVAKDPNKYQLITRTVMYKLPLMKTKESVADMIYVEFSLWFHHSYSAFKKKEGLAEAIFAFKETHLTTDPFERGQPGQSGFIGL